MSTDKGKDMILLSNDHKPEDEEERKRIIKNGGKVYQ
jgi:serine/threonine protein phosphatase PrpC